VLAQVPSGADDPNILPHVIASMARGRLVTFGRDDRGDSTKGTALHLLHSLGEDLPEENSEWDLTLSSAPSWCGGAASVAELQASATFVKGAVARVANSLGVAHDRVHVTSITEGSVHLKYTVTDLTCKEKERILSSDITGQLRSEFDTFVKLNVSPAVLALHFNLNDLDPLGHKSSDQFCSTFEVGPPGKTRTYHQPCGWTRYGFKVLGKYSEDTWLSPFQDAGNWYRAFHGTGRSGGSAAPAAKGIVDGGFKASSGGKLGAGVYTSPLVQYVEGGYCPTLQLKLSAGTKQFKFVLQVAVRPGGIIQEGHPDASGTNQEWTAQAQDVRPYGLLIKEV